MIVADRMRRTYPKLSGWIYENLAKVPKKTKVFDAFIKYAEMRSHDARAMLTMCSPTPIIDFKDLDTPTKRRNGQFNAKKDPNRVFLALAICEKFENSETHAADPRMHLLVESTLLHELVHWGDSKDGKDQEGEEGKAFEAAAYGRDIRRYW